MIFNEIKYFPINWENGMKLNSGHFEHLENSIEDNVRDNRALALNASNAYGLLPFSPFSLQNAQGQNAQSVRVILNACRALLPGGYRVEILPDNVQKLKIPEDFPFIEFVPNASTRYHIFLTVNSEERIPAGPPETRPIRKPYLIGDYALELVPHEKFKSISGISTNRIKIAEWQDKKLIEAYIPPCLSVEGFPLMKRWYEFFQNQIENVVRISTHVVNEYRKKDPNRAEFCVHLVNFLRGNRGTFDYQIPKQSPSNMIVFFLNFAAMLDGLLDVSDRDFVRNVLKNGQVNDLRTNSQALFKRKGINPEDMANHILDVKKFIDSLIATLQSLISTSAPKPKVGERKISSG